MKTIRRYGKGYMRDRLNTLGATVMVALLALLPACTLEDNKSPTGEPAVKLSRNEICHERGTSGYAQTKNYTPFDTLAQCLTIGRLPRGNGETVTAAVPDYDRDAFGGWIDADGDCINTRHEILKELSTAAVDMKNGCSVGRGRWVDPYTNIVFLDAADLDIDHIVPLAYAWKYGAYAWPAERRVAFANDPVNLLAVQAAANRSKGQKGPTEWLPPETGYRCQYVLRFQRIAASYDLALPAEEAAQIQNLRTQYC